METKQTDTLVLSKVYPGEEYQLKRLKYLDKLAPLCQFEKSTDECTPEQLNARREYSRVLAKSSEWEVKVGL